MNHEDKRELIVGIATTPIAYGSTPAMREAGARLAVEYLNGKAEPFVRRSPSGLAPI